MRVSKILKEIVYKLDFFVTAQVLRVNSEPDYKTLVGGFISITIIVVLLITFYSKVIDTLDKITIKSAFDSTHFEEPQPLHLSTFDEGKFMFGVEIWKHDLNTGDRLFDVVLRNTYYINGDAMIDNPKTINISLQACTRQHWAGYPEIIQKFDSIGMKEWLCLPKNQTYELYGKFSSKQSMTLDVLVQECSNDSNIIYNNRSCASPEYIDDKFKENGNFFYTIYFVNSLINPSSHNYISYYLQDSNYVIFDRNGGQEAQIWVEDFKITTDESIFPFEELKVQSGFIITKNAIKNRYNTVNGLYGTFTFFKSPNSQTIVRSFEKIDQVLSYIGGLFGTIALLLFIFSIYNEYSFEIAIAGYLYHKKYEGKEDIYKTYNFVYFIGELIYGVLKKIKMPPNWPRIKEFYDCSEEMIRQLDVLYLIKRVNYLERSMQLLIDDHQAKGLHLMKQLTLQQAKEIRLKYKFKSKIKSQMSKRQKYLAKTMQEGNMLNIQKKETNNISRNTIQNFQEEVNIDINRQNTKDSKSSYELVSAERFEEEQCYTSESESQEEQHHESLIESIKILDEEKEQNSFSLRIWEHIDKNVKDMFIQYKKNKEIKGMLIENDENFESLLIPEANLVSNVNDSCDHTKINNSTEFMGFNEQKPPKYLPKIHRQNARKIIMNEYIGDQTDFQQISLQKLKIRSQNVFRQFL